MAAHEKWGCIYQRLPHSRFSWSTKSKLFQEVEFNILKMNLNYFHGSEAKHDYLGALILAVIIRLCARLLPKAYLSLIYTYLLRTKIKEATFYSKILSQLNHTKLS